MSFSILLQWLLSFHISNNFLTINIIYNICPWCSILDFTDYKIFFVATIAIITKKSIFHFSMATGLRETNSFIKSFSWSIQTIPEQWNQTDKLLSRKIVSCAILLRYPILVLVSRSKMHQFFSLDICHHISQWVWFFFITPLNGQFGYFVLRPP